MYSTVENPKQKYFKFGQIGATKKKPFSSQITSGEQFFCAETGTKLLLQANNAKELCYCNCSLCY